MNTLYYQATVWFVPGMLYEKGRVPVVELAGRLERGLAGAGRELRVVAHVAPVRYIPVRDQVLVVNILEMLIW